jgi:hypothetical protein
MDITLAYSDGFTELLLYFEVIIANGTATVAYRWFAPHHPSPHGEFALSVEMAKWAQIEHKLRDLAPYYGITMDDLHSVDVWVRGSAIPDYQRSFYALGPNLYREYPALRGPLIEISQFVDFCKTRCYKIAIATLPQGRR